MKEVVICWTAPSTMLGQRRYHPEARGTPRIANNLIHLPETLQSSADGKINQQIAADALELLEIDSRGLDEMDKRILSVMAVNYKGGPVGLGTVAVAVNEEEHTLEEVHEPYLIQEGYIKRTPRGEELTPKGWEAIGQAPGQDPKSGQLSLM